MYFKKRHQERQIKVGAATLTTALTPLYSYPGSDELRERATPILSDFMRGISMNKDLAIMVMPSWFEQLMALVNWLGLFQREEPAMNVFSFAAAKAEKEKKRKMRLSV